MTAPGPIQAAGRYFANRKANKCHKSSYDTATTACLWQMSAELVGLAADPSARSGRATFSLYPASSLQRV